MKLLAMNKLTCQIEVFDDCLGMWMPYANLQKEYDPNTDTYYKGYYTPEGKWVSMAVYDESQDEWIECWTNKIKSYSLMGVEY